MQDTLDELWDKLNKLKNTRVYPYLEPKEKNFVQLTETVFQEIERSLKYRGIGIDGLLKKYNL
jgi:hypothetical protein